MSRGHVNLLVLRGSRARVLGREYLPFYTKSRARAVGVALGELRGQRGALPRGSQVPLSVCVTTLCDQFRHRRRGAGGPRAGLAAAAVAGVSPSPREPSRRRGPRPSPPSWRRRRQRAGSCAAADDWRAEEAQDAHPQLHQLTDAGCAALAAALDSGALPALKNLFLGGITS